MIGRVASVCALCLLMLLAACVSLGEPASGYEACAREGSTTCTLHGVMTEQIGAHARLGLMRLADGRCINVSLPPEAMVRLTRDGPQQMTITGEVYGYPQGLILEIEGRTIGAGNCGDFFVFVR